MSKRKSGSRCAVQDCGVYTMDKTYSFFGFPKEPEKCKQWLLKIGRVDFLNENEMVDMKAISASKICAKHFDSKMFANFQKNRLFDHAVPAHHLPKQKGLFEEVFLPTWSGDEPDSVSEEKKSRLESPKDNNEPLSISDLEKLYLEGENDVERKLPVPVTNIPLVEAENVEQKLQDIFLPTDMEQISQDIILPTDMEQIAQNIILPTVSSNDKFFFTPIDETQILIIEETTDTDMDNYIEERLDYDEIISIGSDSGEDDAKIEKVVPIKSSEIVQPTKILVPPTSSQIIKPIKTYSSSSQIIKPTEILVPQTSSQIIKPIQTYSSSSQIIKSAPILLSVLSSCQAPKEGDCVRFLRKQAGLLNLAIKVVTLVPKKPVVILTWEGKQPKLPAILLNSHMDVVPVSEEYWDYPPFAAKMDSKGNIFARGSQDMKCVGIMYLEAIRRLKNKGIKLKRTLHLSFVPDEEVGGNDGMRVFAKSKEFQELNIGFSLDEGLIHGGEEFIVFYAEKIIWQIHVHCGGTPGHGSSLQGNTSGEKFRYMVNKFLDYRDQQIKLNGGSPAPGDDVTAVNLTKVYGGLQENIIPDKLTAVFDIRHSIKQNLTKFEEMINKWCKEAGPDVTIEYKQKDTLGGITALDKTNPFWVAFKSTTDKLNLNLNTITCPGSTDSRFIRLLGIPALGFTPINKTPMLLHAHNEFVNKDSLLKGIGIYYEILTAIANV